MTIALRLGHIPQSVIVQACTSIYFFLRGLHTKNVYTAPIGKSRPHYLDALIENNHAYDVSMTYVSWLDQEVYSRISSSTTSEGDVTSIKKCEDQLLGRELCELYRGSWSANHYAPIS